MNLVVFGAAGMVGSRVVTEAIGRGHRVRAVVRDLSRASAIHAGADLQAGDASDPDAVRTLIGGQDVAVSAVRPPAGREFELVTATKGVLEGTAGTGVRLLVVGGAASLRIPGTDQTVLDGPDFPASWRPIAEACNEQLAACRSAADVDWTYLSPPALLEPGPRTGRYRLGRDDLVVGRDGVSRISAEDLAVALLDEAEQPRHRGRRFTAGY
jgi:uncharacterized protein